MDNLIVTCLATALIFIIAERVFPARPLEKVEGWWGRVFVVNCVQAGLVILGGYTWDPFFKKIHLTNLTQNISPFWGGLFGYFVLSFVYYWWHKWRHDVQFLWRWLHQLHHTPTRIETLTSFYKHPFEILTNTVLTSSTCYIFLGMSIPQTTWAIYFLAVAEYCYHVNIRTPRWLGYIIQRPEMHRIHHQRGLHRFNYADLPIWDILFGTFYNPEDQPEACGLGIENERHLGKILRGYVIEDSYEK
ncbi:MAG TPA: sterol desaturase family protein [Bdellovibrio sp.]|nr:sterol desaturase family protein [Bdellovibrio sp.]